MVGSSGNTTTEVFQNIMKIDGWKGLFRGNLVNVIRVAPSKAIEHVWEHHWNRISIPDIETTVNSRSAVPYSRAEIMFLLEKLGDDKIMIHEDTVYIL
ncbi:hypothetical protein CsSME_00053638 [Camellia sinensis var. sinensis]